MAEYIELKHIQKLIPKRNDLMNKGSFGRVLNIAGSKLYSGAAFLSSVSSLKTGAGYVSLACPQEIIDRIAPNAPELTFIPLKSNNNGSISTDNKIDDIENYDVISLGCGLTTDIETQRFVFSLIKQFNDRQKVIIDADGINILAERKSDISLKNKIITPHPKELSRLLNVSPIEINDNREKYARITAQTYDCIVVLKGHNTIITNGDKIYLNTTGSSALAKAGTGDVLTGIISGLLSQKLSLFNAAIFGVYLHGLAGDIAAERLTKYSVLASDVIDNIPNALKKIIGDFN